MLIILLIFALIRTLRSVPLSSPLEPPDTYFTLDTRDTQSHLGERAVSDIVLSCFTTILACTFSAVHPNVPPITDGAWTRLKDQFAMMVYALLLPEAITAWALRQRLAARKIVRIYNRSVATKVESQETQKPTSMISTICAMFQNTPLPPVRKANEVPRWTLAHSFLFQMRGFMLSEGGRPIQTLNAYWEEHGIGWNMENRDIQIERPLITEDDIQDRTKNDAISKTLIILQTTWFIAQCIARWVGQLPVTELEVVTLGFAMLNGITYGLWWHKPQNVGRPVFLEIKRYTPPEPSSRNSNTKQPEITVARADSKEPSVPRNGKPESDIPHKVRERSGNSGAKGSKITEAQADSKNTSIPTAVKQQSSIQPKVRERPADSGAKEPEILVAQADSKVEPISQNVKSERIIQRNDRENVEKKQASSAPWMGLYRIPFHFSEGLLHLLGKVAHHDHRHLEFEPGDLRVEMFYSRSEEDKTIYGLTTIIGVHFGLVHLIPSWFLVFASVEEQWLWRVSATIITIGIVFLNLWEYFYRKKSSWESTFRAFLIIMLPLYLISRVVLMTISLTSLRSLPPAALQTIEWTTFIPHI